MPAAVVQAFDQIKLGSIAGGRVIAGFPCLQMRLRHDRERIGGSFQFVPAVPVVGEANHREFQTHGTPPTPVTEAAQGFSDRIAQHRQAHHRTVVAVEQPVVIDIHPLGEIAFRLALHFDMDQHPVIVAIPTAHLDQFVGESPAQFRIPHHLLQFLVEEGVSLAPVDPGVRLREEQGHELREIPFQRGFPGAVEVGHLRRIGALLPPQMHCPRSARRVPGGRRSRPHPRGGASSARI